MIEDQQEPLPPPPLPPQSRWSRFLRSHVPLYGSCMDVSSAICTPVLDTLLKYVNRDLLVSKIFYFFFYSAFGSLFPLMGVYFKQLGMNPTQVGILTGVRPFIEIFSAPFWSGLAEKFQKGKALLLFSLISWIVFTYSLAHIRPPASACIAFNDTDYVLYTPYSQNDLGNYDYAMDEQQQKQELQETSTMAGRENELFIRRMPSSESEEEGKDKVLAVEENQSVQGSRRRRRRKRQVAPANSDQLRPPSSPDKPDMSRFVYYSQVDGQNLDKNFHSESAEPELKIDFENDFEDVPLSGGASKISSRSAESDQLQSIFGDSWGGGDDESVEDGTDDDSELKSSQGKALWRYRRAATARGDYESDDQEAPAETEKLTRRQDQGSNGRAEEQEEEEEEENEVSRENGNEARGGEFPEARENNYSGRGRQAKTRPHEQHEKELRQRIEMETSKGDGEFEKEKQMEKELANEKYISAEEQHPPSSANKTKKIYRQRHKTPPTHIVGISPIHVQFAINYNKEKHSQFVTPMFSTIVYKLDDIKNFFFLLLLLISLGEFFSAPAITIADSITLQYLGDNTDLYGRQRTFGSLGWAITLLLVGMALDDSKYFHDHPCGPHIRERSYTVCFTIFSILMCCAFVTATKFNYPSSQQQFKRNQNGSKGSSAVGGQTLVTSTMDNDQVVTTTAADASAVDDFYASTRPREIFNTAPPVNAPSQGDGSLGQSGKEKFEFLDKWKSAMFAQRTRELPQWVNVFRQFFRNPLHLTYLFITWFLGCGVGLVFTFLFWHLQDVGGTPTLFGICSVINHISEVLAYFFSSHFIKRFGHTKVLSVGLGCNLVRFLYVAFLTNPYYALPFELVQGITHAACFAACCSYMSHVSKPELKVSTQGVMQGLHHGIGRACGTLMGGYMINAMGSRASFCIYGLLSGCVLGGFLYVRRRASMVNDVEVKMDDNEALGDYGAPQGVPSALTGTMNAQQPAPPQEYAYEW